MSWSQQSESPEALSDPLPRIYACFCEKRFTTYPGIYLHLKSKHSHLFQKYKKLKITKLFKKTHDDKGIEIYKLDKLSDIDGPGSYFNQKKIKQNKKRTREELHHLDLSPELEKEKEPQINNEPSRNLTSVQQNFNSHQSLKLPLEMNKDIFQAMSSYMPFPPLRHNYPFGFGSHAPPLHSYIPPPFSLFSQPRPSIKKLLEKFLIESEKEDMAFIKNTLYNLMVFLDQNCEQLNDSRAKGKVFFSYCDEFDPLLIKPLLQQYISKKNDEISQIQNDNDKKIRHKEVDCLIKFFVWLGELGLIQFSLKVSQRKEDAAPLSLTQETLMVAKNNLSGEESLDKMKFVEAVRNI